ncbi:MAG: hypothetical protein V1846_05135 [Candidatus Komeilibacteria bacterium]
MTFDNAKAECLKIIIDILDKEPNIDKKTFWQILSGWPNEFRDVTIRIQEDFIENNNQTFAVAKSRDEAVRFLRGDSSILADILLLSSPLGENEFSVRRKKLQDLISRDVDLNKYFETKDRFIDALSQKIDLRGFLSGTSTFDLKDIAISNLQKGLRNRRKSFGTKFWRFICIVVAVAILPSTILQFTKLIYQIQTSNNDYSLGFVTGQLTVNLVILGIAIWFFVKLRKH